MKKGIRSAVAAALCVCLTFTALTGCSKRNKDLDTKAAMLTLDKESISVGAASVYLRYQQAEFENGFGQFIKSYYGDIWNSDLTGSGEAYGNQFKEQILTGLQHMLLTKIHAGEFDVSLSDEDQTAIREAAESFVAANGEDVLAKIGANTDSVEEMLSLYTLMTRTETAMGADVDTEVSDEEAAQRTVSYVFFNATTEAEEDEEESELAEAASEGAEAVSEAAFEAESEVRTQSADSSETEIDPAEVGEAVTEEAQEAVTEAVEETETESPEMQAARAEASARAEAFLAQVLAGDDFAQAAAEVTADESMHASTSSYTFGDDDSYPTEEIREATKGLEDGAIVDRVIQVGTSYYVLHVDDAFDEAATEDRKVEIVEERRDDAVQSYYDEWTEDVQFNLNTEQWVALAFDVSLAYPEAETEGISEAATEGENVAESATES